MLFLVVALAAALVLLLLFVRERSKRLVAERGRRDPQELTRLRCAVEHMAEMLVVTDRDGLIRYVNPAFERVTGYSKDEVLGVHPRILGSGRPGDAARGAHKATIESGRVWSGRVTRRKKSGELYEEEATLSPVRDAEGNIVDFVAVGRDITDELVLEEQLLQSQKMEAVGRLAGGVAHDFNNLLTTISGYVSVLSQSLPGDDDRQDDLNEVERAVGRGADLTRRLLAFSRRDVVRPRLVDVGRVVTSTMALLRRAVGDNIELTIDLDPQPVMVVADPGQLEQMLTNLVVNAREAMPAGGTMRVAVRACELGDDEARRLGVAAPGLYAKIVVSDTGIGIPSDVLGHVFEPFFTTKTKSEGNGLGLATVYAIVERAGGVVRVHTTPGRGSEFGVYLPLSTSGGVPAQAAAEDPTSPPPRGSEGVLVVEDEPAVLRLTTRMLSSLGYQVFGADNGEAALRVMEIEGPRIQCVVTDVLMPKMTGPRMVSLLRETHPELPVVFMSGYVLEADGDLMGAVEDAPWFIPKPFTADQLARTVRSALDA